MTKKFLTYIKEAQAIATKLWFVKSDYRGYEYQVETKWWRFYMSIPKDDGSKVFTIFGRFALGKSETNNPNLRTDHTNKYNLHAWIDSELDVMKGIDYYFSALELWML